ncbi:hypothetical protein KDL01_09395 [Actinospica durhamensis]|uniref:Uncharacterized protein n=1 Tax=Actinospica durhamensis TaxID=1508375 RepID=A0A941ETC1_9ACTN|nr:hypothetical protein [Actinospica durhamensis]MBR7833479.1 hypothetical protein [Actinospica durhamensis]
MSRIPDNVRAEVIVELYRQADQLDWEMLSTREKTTQYQRWIDDPAVGGVLTKYLPAEEARVWIKDVPMKEFVRAQEGLNNFSQYVVRRFAGPEEIVKLALGQGWRVVPDSAGEKPAHCRATDGTTTRYLCWGKDNTMRDLVWAALNQAIDMKTTPLIIITYRSGHAVSKSDQQRHLEVARHCGIELKHIQRTMVSNVPPRIA